MVVTTLLLAMLGFAFLSADAASFLRFEQARMVAFTAIVAAIVALAMMRRPNLSARMKTVPIILIVLLALIALVDSAGEMSPVDYKIVLLLAVALAAPNLAWTLRPIDPVAVTYLALAAYVGVTFVLTFAAIPVPDLRGQPGALRWDFTGSLVGHSGLCVIFAVLALAHLLHSRTDRTMALHIVLGAIALFMAFMTGTRTVLISLCLTGLLALLASRSPARTMAHLGALGLCLGVALLLQSLLFSDALVARLFEGSSEDYSSGRWHSQAHWLALTADHPLGLGLGAVRETLRDGRPALDGQRLLEWPHNEFLRFWVEGGPLGLAFVLLLVGWLTVKAVLAAWRDDDIRRRLLMLALTADMLAQSAFQNYFNGIYHATAMITLVLTWCVRAEDSRAHDSPAAEPERGSGVGTASRLAEAEASI